MVGRGSRRIARRGASRRSAQVRGQVVHRDHGEGIGASVLETLPDGLRGELQQALHGPEAAQVQVHRGGQARAKRSFTSSGLAPVAA